MIEYQAAIVMEEDGFLVIKQMPSDPVLISQELFVEMVKRYNEAIAIIKANAK